MYRRPIFTPFGSDLQKIASSGDPVNPTFESGTEEVPEEGTSTYPTGTLNALNYGKLLASGEAGYFDIGNQGYQVERLNEKSQITKPSGEGIDYHYPSPPDMPSSHDGNSNEYWGMPSGANLGYFQSGIFIRHNDDSEHLGTGNCLQFYNRQDKRLNAVTSTEDLTFVGETVECNDYTLGVFNPNGMGSAFSSASTSNFEKFWMKKGENLYTPMCTDGVYVLSTYRSTQRTTSTFDSTQEESEQTTLIDVSSTFKDNEFTGVRLIPQQEFGSSSSQKGYGFSIEEAIVDSFLRHLEFNFGGEIDAIRSIEETTVITDRAEQTDLLSEDNFSTLNTISASGVIGKIEFTLLSDTDGLYEVETQVEICRTEQTYQGFGTYEFIMNHKGTGLPDDDEQSAVIIPYLGDYKIVKAEEVEEQKTGLEKVKCGEIKTNVEKTFEGE